MKKLIKNTKKFKEDAKELGKTILSGVFVLAILFGLFIGSIKFFQWLNERESCHQTAHQEITKYVPADGGYYATLETTTSTYGDGDIVTRKSLRFIPTKTNTFFADSTGLEDITFWDVENDGKWDEVFLCGYPTSIYGANSIVLGDDPEDWSSWKFETCPADKDMKPFDACTIQHVMELIKQV